MPFQKIVMPTMKELFVRQMESMILSGELSAGEQLPNERDLAAQMNISRTVVNSGIQELAKNGFVCIVPRKGTFVNDFLRQGNLGTLTSIFHHSGGQFDMSMLTALMEYRSINEQKCARLAAERHTAEDLKRMFELLEQMESCHAPEECAEISTQFHHAIFLATQNLIFPLMYNSFQEMSMAVTRIPPPPASPGLHRHAQRSRGHCSTGRGSGGSPYGRAYGTVQPDPAGTVSLRADSD